MNTTFTVRSEKDVLALVPFTLGFHPEDSLVLLTTSRRGRTFQARIDLPHDPDELPEAVEVLVRAAARNRADVAGTSALIVAYTDDEALAEATAERLGAALELEGFTVLMSIRADGSRWFPLGGHSPVAGPGGQAYDVRTHELTSRAVLDGRVTFGNRQELVDSLAPVDLEALDEVHSALAALPALDACDPDRLREEGRWLVARVHAHVHSNTVPPPAEVARIARAVGHGDIRDLTWGTVSRPAAAAHARFWRAVVQRCPEEVVASPASVLAFTAWLSGDGALAWCAVDRALRSDPDHTLARLVAEALESATPPSSWQPLAHLRPDPRVG